jgi:geranylgeranyl diphosphate synthase type II
LIDSYLDRNLPSEKEEPKSLHKAMRYSVFSGGKRLRPIITLESAQACGGSQSTAIPAACAVELIHTYSLIHDDLPSMDDDDYRRGMLSCHKKFGEATAILAGDALLTLAFNIIAADLEPKKGSAIIRELSKGAGTCGMVGGQAFDLEYKSKKKNIKTLNYINRLKTAKLFEVSAKAGAIASGANKKKIAAMAGYGINLGMAFQIPDDIADEEGYAKIFGMERARCDAQNFIKKAKYHLKTFGKRAKGLEAIADNLWRE